MKKIQSLVALVPLMMMAVACGSSSSSLEVSSSSSSEEPSSSSSISSEETVKTISTADQLKAIADDLDGDYVLSADITLGETLSRNGPKNLALTDNWNPIGTQSHPFTGTIDGNGHWITGLADNAAGITYESVQETVGDVTTTKAVGYLGLFGVNAGTISNLNVGDYLFGNADFPDSFVADEIRVHAGGIAAINAGTIDHSSSSGYMNITSVDGRLRVGGLVGLNVNGIITSSSSLPTILATSQANKVAAGGLVGESEGAEALLSKVKVTDANISATYDGDELLEMQAYAGGLVAVLDGGTVNNAYSDGTVSSSISGAKPAYAGGLIGMFDDETYDISVSNAYSSCIVSATSTTANKVYVGGLLGRYEDKLFGHVVSLTNALASGSVDGVTLASTKAYSGPLVGSFDVTGWTLTNSYFAGTATFTGKSNATVACGTQTTLETIDVATMGWDASIWSISSGVVALSI